MKSNVPWSVKGIDPEARVVAKEAARKAGMTLGEWMTSMIHELGTEEEDAPAHIAAATKSAVTTDQLRSVVDSLNRLNERLKSTEDNLRKTEEKSRQAVGGLHEGLETVFERIKRMEKSGASAATGGTPSSETKTRLANLKSLERALSQMVDQFESSQKETLSRVANNENAVSTLSNRVDVLDKKVTAGFQEVQDAMDNVTQHLDQTERTAKAVMLEAREAAGSTDAEFVERTGKKLQLLGNEIKRSGDQISTVEGMVKALSEKIEDAERRSAEGIAEIAQDLNLFKEQTASSLSEAGAATTTSASAAAAAAEETVASLQKSYDEMIDRLEGKVPTPQTAPQIEASLAQAAENAPAPREEENRPPVDTLITDVTPKGTTPSDNVLAAVASPVVATATLGTISQPDPAASEKKATVEEQAPHSEADFDAVFGDPAEPTEGKAPAEADSPSKPIDPKKLTPREKIFLAAKARKERAARERAAEEAAGAEGLPDNAPQTEDKSSNETSTVDQSETIGEAQTKDTSQNRRIGLPLVALLGLLLLAMAAAATLFFNRSGGGTTGAAGELPSVTADGPATQSVPLTPNVGASDTPAPVSQPIDSTPNGNALYEQGKDRLQTAVTEADQRAAFNIIQEAAIYGNVPAQFLLGELFFKGRGTEQDLRQAKRWFENAAMSGNALAMHRLGSLAYDSKIDGQNYALALDWFGRAANYGVVDSMYNLGYLYDPAEEALPAEFVDANRSYRWLSIAASQGDELAASERIAVADRLEADVVASIDAEVENWSALPIDPLVNDGLQIPQ